MANMNVQLQDLRQIPTPPSTPTFTRIPHFDLAQTVLDQVEKLGLSVINERYDLTKNGQRLFAALTIDTNGSDQTQFMLGYRHGHDGYLSLGFCSGINIMVCSNMQFNGDYMTFRRHTKNLNMGEVEHLAHQALIELPSQKKVFDDKLEAWGSVGLDDKTHKSIVYDLMAEGVMPPSKFQDYHGALIEEGNLEHAMSLATVHNGVTRLYRKRSLINLTRTTPRLTEVVDDYYHKLAA